jgi:hypothetical protein
MKHRRIALVIALALCSMAIWPYATKRDIPNSPYVRNSFGVYWLEGERCEMIVGCFGGHYVKLRGANPRTFRILNSEMVGMVLARDDKHLYYANQLVPDADLATLQMFKGFDNAPYAKDRNNVYLGGLVLRGLDTDSVEYLGDRFIKDSAAVYAIGDSGAPIVAGLMDTATMQVPHKHFYATIWEDANFTYDYGASPDGRLIAYRVHDVKTNDPSFKRLGCNYVQFRGKIFHSVFEVQGADPASFHVLPPSDGSNLDACTTDAIAEDTHGRYVDGRQLDLSDENDLFRARRIEATLHLETAPTDTIVHSEICDHVDHQSLHWSHTDATAGFRPAAVKFVQYRHVIDAEIWSTRGLWQPLPRIAGHMHTCDLISSMSFDDPDAARARERGDPSALTLRFPNSGDDAIFVLVDGKGDIRLAFAHSRLTRALRDMLEHSPLTQRSFWAHGMNLETATFLNRQGRPELWPTLHVRGSDKQVVEIGFEYIDGSLRCIDEQLCAKWQVPQSTPIRLEVSERRKSAA